jgi:hypothetical protein
MIFYRNGLGKMKSTGLSGDYIAIADADDIWELDKLENQAGQIGDNWLCSGISKPFYKTGSPDFDERMPNYSIERLIHIASVLPGHTMLMKREILPMVLTFRTFPILYDHIISLVTGSYGKITFVDKVLVNYRVHADSETYTVLVMSRSRKGNRGLSNIGKSVIRTLRLYTELRGKMRDWFKMILQFLQSLPAEGAMHEDALKIALYRSRKGFVNYLKLTCLYVKLRRRIFHEEEKDGILTMLRAIYFPISCSDYFGYMSESNKK